MNVANNIIRLSVQKVVCAVSFPDYFVKRNLYECHFTQSHYTASAFFFVLCFFLKLLLTIYFSNDLAQDVLMLFWSKLLVTHSTLGIQDMVNWWSSQEMLFPLTPPFLAQNTSPLNFFLLICHAHSLYLVFSDQKQKQ